MKIFDLIIKLIAVIGLAFICFMFYAAFKESELKDDVETENKNASN